MYRGVNIRGLIPAGVWKHVPLQVYFAQFLDPSFPIIFVGQGSYKEKKEESRGKDHCYDDDFNHFNHFWITGNGPVELEWIRGLIREIELSGGKVTKAYYTESNNYFDLINFDEFFKEARRVGRYAGLTEDEVVQIKDWEGFEKILRLMNQCCPKSSVDFYPDIFVEWCNRQGYLP